MATFNPLKSADNEPAEGTEYGGRPGFIQPKSLGHNIDAPDHVQEKVAIIHFEAFHSAQVMEDLPPTDEHYDAVLELQQLRAARLGEYTIEDAL